MPHSKTHALRRNRKAGPTKPKTSRRYKPGPRYTVSLPPTIAVQVERYAEKVDASLSKAIAALVRLGLESRVNRKHEFFKRLNENLAKDDLNEPDQVLDDFRTLILGR